MQFINFVIQIVSILYILYAAPVIITQQIRAVVHDRGYTAGLIDFALAVTILALILLGIPTI